MSQGNSLRSLNLTTVRLRHGLHGRQADHGGDISGFTFEGGYLGVSGSTGWASNYHRFDNLDLEGCVVP
jgi:hypothetical protein